MGQIRESEDTFPKLLLRNYRRWGDSGVFMRSKALGIWQEHTWKDCYEKVRLLSLGLMSTGLEPGNRVAILGDNSPEWFWSELAAQSAGGVTVGLLADGLPDEIRYMVGQSQAKFVVARDQEQVDKLLEVAQDLPLLSRVIYWNSKGLMHYNDPLLLSFDGLIALGKEYDKSHPGLFEETLLHGKGEDPCMILYTSGTTGLPKGAVVSYNFVRSNIQERLTIGTSISERDEWFSSMLPGWGPEQGLGLVTSLLAGQKMSFPEGTETVAQDLREISPTSVSYPARMWEQLVSAIRVNMSDASWHERVLFGLCLRVGYRVTDQRVGTGRVNILWKALHMLAEFVQLKTLRDRHGLARVRTSFAGGSTLSPEVVRFLHAIGLRVRQLYSTAEAGVISVDIEDSPEFASVGRLACGVCVRVADTGRALISNETPFLGYCNNPEATRESVADGWFYTGDVCSIDNEGRLIFVDRLNDLRQLADGAEFSPQYIESRLKFSPYVRDALVFGGETRGFVGAILNIDSANVSKWAESQRIAYATFLELSQKPEVVQLISGEIERLNVNLPPGCQIKRFVNLHKEFDADEAELTRTGKLRRAFVEDRYKELIDAVYSQRDEVVVEAAVVYRDGGTGMISGSIRINRLS